ncbi:Uncharacterised protein [Burkholderia pseudomallei]|nr:C4-dicarboxylate anaerobic carrier family domain protein [Burkholderia pseudomallei TSV44]KIX34593.1 hypothetical protein SZ28_29135 [Burkholderia pseudomallei]CAJ3349956.1 Uncharacterised protein [Burkholderia pseudomallei]CAJ9241831.1 Uncharacterised protein [Burkholderia pseudomallei]CAK1343920.1 Uncharacterised protein [Burkholderia pseudomallei]
MPASTTPVLRITPNMPPTNITITMSGAFFTSPPGTATNADTRLAGIASCGVLLLTAGATSVASDVAFGTT